MKSDVEAKMAQHRLGALQQGVLGALSNYGGDAQITLNYRDGEIYHTAHVNVPNQCVGEILVFISEALRKAREAQSIAQRDLASQLMAQEIRGEQ